MGQMKEARLSVRPEIVPFVTSVQTSFTAQPACYSNDIGEQKPKGQEVTAVHRKLHN
jgi:hypothetical protein